MAFVIGVSIACIIACVFAALLFQRSLPHKNSRPKFAVLDILLMTGLIAALLGILAAIRTKVEQDRKAASEIEILTNNSDLLAALKRPD